MPFSVQNLKRPEMKARVKPVGAINAIGWPHNIEYAYSINKSRDGNSDENKMK